VVLDIATYCRVQTDRPPTANSRKDLLKEWLDADDAMKIELHELIKLSKPNFRIFHVDGILAEWMFVYIFLPTTPSLMPQKKFGPLLKTGWLQGM
jgi:hypothetical protein